MFMTFSSSIPHVSHSYLLDKINSAKKGGRGASFGINDGMNFIFYIPRISLIWRDIGTYTSLLHEHIYMDDDMKSVYMVQDAPTWQNQNYFKNSRQKKKKRRHHENHVSLFNHHQSCCFIYFMCNRIMKTLSDHSVMSLHQHHPLLDQPPMTF